MGQVRNAASGRVLKRAINNRGGYWIAYVRMDGRTAARNIHRLVAEAFIPNPDNLPCVNHINGDILDPREENLEWCTHKQNTAHAMHVLKRDFVRNLKNGKGENCHSHVLTEVEVRSIKRLLAGGVRQRDIAERFGITATTICSINRGRLWGHVA